MEQENKIVLEGRNLSKEFNGNVVLRDVSLQCAAGEGIALVGENGAGKSTLMNILSGGLHQSAGVVLVDGKEMRFASSVQARALGIAFVHQELSLMHDMTVGENIMLGLEPRRCGLIQQKELHRKAAELLAEIGYELNVHQMVWSLSPAQRQITEIAKAWAGRPRVMIFDEPTSSLNKAESNLLFEFIRRIKSQGVSVIMISHRMDDIFATCDRVVVLKDGEFVFSASAAETCTDELICKMVGRDVRNAFPPRNQQPNPEIRVSLRGASVGNRVRNISLDIPAGTVVGIGGLEGQGQRELGRALFGAEPFTAGDYLIDGKPVKIHSPVAAVKNRIAFVPDDRKSEGLFLQLSVTENILSLVLNEHSICGFVRKKQAMNEVLEGIRQLKIKVSDPELPVQSLSGGNQQKVVFSKWVKTKPRILYLHEPTRGVDVQSKLEIYELIRSLTREGLSVVVFTSDMLELIGLSDEIYVMYEGEISGHIAGSEATEEKIMQLSASKREGEAS